MRKTNQPYGPFMTLLMVTLSQTCISTGYGQVPTDTLPGAEGARIEWISQYPSQTDHVKRGIWEKIGVLLTGKKFEGLSKPISVLALDTSSFWVLDQGVQLPVEVQDHRSQIPRVFRKLDQGFPSLVGICLSAGGDIYFTDSRLGKIYRMDKGRKDLTVINDTLQLMQPTGIAISPVDNHLYVVETMSHRILVLDQQGGVVKTIGNRGEEPGNFNFPTFIWIDKEGLIYVVDSMNFRVQIFNSEGELQSYFGKLGDATGYFARPKGVAVDSHGHIYVVDALFNAVQVFDREGNLLDYFGKQGQEKGYFWLPSGIYIDKDDFIYVADRYNSRVQVFQLKMN